MDTLNTEFNDHCSKRTSEELANSKGVLKEKKDLYPQNFHSTNHRKQIFTNHWLDLGGGRK